MADSKLHWETVAEEEAIEFLTGASRPYFEPFLGRACSVAQVARELKVAPNKLLYHVHKAYRLGLLRVTQVQQRAGKPIKIYQSSADMYFIPFELTSAETLESWLMPLEDEWHARWVNSAARTMRRSQVKFGLRLWREENEVVVKPTPEPPIPVDDSLLDSIPVLVLWSELRLNANESRALYSELLDLYEKYARNTPQACEPASHLLHLAVTPIQP